MIINRYRGKRTNQTTKKAAAVITQRAPVKLIPGSGALSPGIRMRRFNRLQTIQKQRSDEIEILSERAGDGDSPSAGVC